MKVGDATLGSLLGREINTRSKEGLVGPLARLASTLIASLQVQPHIKDSK